MSLFRRNKVEPVPTASREEALAAIPSKNREVAEEATGDGYVRVVYQVTYKPWFGNLASRLGKWDHRPMTKKLELDELGTAVWKRIDGKRSVRDIAKDFAREYGVLEREAELSVTAFIKQLGRRGILGLR